AEAHKATLLKQREELQRAPAGPAPGGAPPPPPPPGGAGFEPPPGARSRAEEAIASVVKQTEALNLESAAYERLGSAASKYSAVAQAQARLDDAGVGSTTAARNAIEGLTAAVEKNTVVKASTKTEEESAKLREHLGVVSANATQYEALAKQETV